MPQRWKVFHTNLHSWLKVVLLVLVLGTDAKTLGCIFAFEGTMLMSFHRIIKKTPLTLMII